MAHTPGPWEARNHHIYTEDAPVHIAQVIRAPDGDWSPDNARLLAAAPDLLEALEWAERTLEAISKASTLESTSWLAPSIRVAIAKAKGLAP